MNLNEFKFQMKRLSDQFGEKTFPESRVNLIWSHVSGFEIKWLARIVERMILSNDPRMNFAEVIASEKHARKQIQLTEDCNAAWDALTSNISDDGLARYLKKINANSLVEALEKAPRQN